MSESEAAHRVLACRTLLLMEGRAIGCVSPGMLSGHRVEVGQVFHLSFDPLDEDGDGRMIVYGCLEGVGPLTPTFDEWARRFVLSGGSGRLFAVSNDGIQADDRG